MDIFERIPVKINHLPRYATMNGGEPTDNTYLRAGCNRSRSCSWATSSKREGFSGSPPTSLKNSMTDQQKEEFMLCIGDYASPKRSEGCPD